MVFSEPRANEISRTEIYSRFSAFSVAGRLKLGYVVYFRCISHMKKVPSTNITAIAALKGPFVGQRGAQYQIFKWPPDYLYIVLVLVGVE